MRRTTKTITGIAFAIALMCGAILLRGTSRSESVAKASPVASPIGRVVPDFTLCDPGGQPHSLHYLGDRKIIVVVFMGCSCPLAKLYGPRLAELAREFAPRGIAFIGINSNAQDSLTDVATYVGLHQIPFPVLKDPDHAVADALGAVRTPEAFVLDADRVVRYWGRIDDQFEIGVQRPAATRRDLAEALADLLAGRTVARPVVPSVGCRIGREPKVVPAGSITYAKEIHRVIEARCVECHRAGEAGPFPLTSYTDVKRWSAMIREVVAADRMPPWFADPMHGTFRNDSRLTTQEKAALLAWIDDGCPEGDVRDISPRAEFVGGWRIPPPDLVVPMSEEPFDVPANGEVMYEYFTVDPGFTEDRFLQAIEVRPGNRAVVHHALVSILPPGADPMQRDHVGAMLDYAPGMQPAVLPDGYAIRVAAGSKFVFQMHYTPNGSNQKDLTRMGLVFVDPARVKHLVQGGAVANPGLELAPSIADQCVVAEQRIDRDVMLLSLSPHMHLRGKAFRIEAVHPDGRRETLLNVPRYDFNWQLRYDLAVPLRLAKGIRLVCTAHYDNSPGNPANPDPSRLVRWGEQTGDEMLIGFYAFVACD